MGRKDGEKPKRSEFTVPLDEGDRDWHEARARKAGLTTAQYVREILLRERLAAELAPEPEQLDRKLSQREAYLQDIRENGAPLQAAQRHGVTPSKAKEWAKSPEFSKQVALARAIYLESLEQEMANIGRGRKKGDTQAIGWLLNAHHPSHGRAKKELILSIINPMVKKLIDFLSVELGADTHERLKKALGDFQIEVRKKLVGM